VKGGIVSGCSKERKTEKAGAIDSTLTRLRAGRIEKRERASGEKKTGPGI